MVASQCYKGNRTVVLDLVSINFTLLVLFISPQFKSHVHG
ncbi:unnamed protein product [Musa acuminata subsp. malaccensis]|uniref:(wild Malaysian banana) hypothetical protein n=1 Tax=Musa acuminata subsp. malaccensis TaxID=214687 RepID=A0A804KA59_MUSAM|nr:unnamed protein product [Musa acuminata subsp. malaccensis]